MLLLFDPFSGDLVYFHGPIYFFTFRIWYIPASCHVNVPLFSLYKEIFQLFFELRFFQTTTPS